MKNHITLLGLAAVLLLATQPGYAAPSQQDKCARQGLAVGCNTPKQAQNRPAHKTIQYRGKHRGKNIDPITTCAVSKDSPCIPKRP